MIRPYQFFFGLNIHSCEFVDNPSVRLVCFWLISTFFQLILSHKTLLNQPKSAGFLLPAQIEFLHWILTYNDFQAKGRRPQAHIITDFSFFTSDFMNLEIITNIQIEKWAEFMLSVNPFFSEKRYSLLFLGSTLGNFYTTTNTTSNTI